MNSGRTTLVFIFPNCIGGVASFNRNLINHTSLKEQCYIKVVLLESAEDKRSRFTDIIEADEIIHFTYSNRENQYLVCKRLHETIGEEKGCIIADNSLTLNTVSLFGTVKRMIYLVHDYFYVSSALHYHRVIDAAIAHSSFFCDVLLAAAVTEYQDKVFYIPYGVELPPDNYSKPRNPIFKLVFLGRLVEEKGALLLKEIDREIQKKDLKVEWTIIGAGPLKQRLHEQWQDSNNVKFIEARDTQEVYSILQEQDILVFPSWFEGTPVSIMEGISRGVIPVVSDLPGGTRDMVTTDIGVRCPVKNAMCYANAIEELCVNPQKLRKMQDNCLTISKTNFNIKIAADAYFSFFFQQAEKVGKNKSESIVQFSSLDKQFIPNWIVYQFRTLKQYFTAGRV